MNVVVYIFNFGRQGKVDLYEFEGSFVSKLPG